MKISEITKHGSWECFNLFREQKYLSFSEMLQFINVCPIWWPFIWAITFQELFTQFTALFCCLYVLIDLFISFRHHYNDVIMSTMASQITSLTVVYSSVYSVADERKHQSSVSLAFVRGIRRRPVNSPYKGLVTRKMFLFDDAIMILHWRPVGQFFLGSVAVKQAWRIWLDISHAATSKNWYYNHTGHTNTVYIFHVHMIYDGDIWPLVCVNLAMVDCGSSANVNTLLQRWVWWPGHPTKSLLSYFLCADESIYCLRFMDRNTFLSMMTSSYGNISALLAICAGNSPVPGECPAQRPVTRSFDVFFDLRLNKRFSKKSWGWWFETPSCPLCRHRNANHSIVWCQWT